MVSFFVELIVRTVRCHVSMDCLPSRCVYVCVCVCVCVCVRAHCMIACDIWMGHRMPCKRARKHYRTSFFHKSHLVWKEVSICQCLGLGQVYILDNKINKTKKQFLKRLNCC